MTPGQIVRVLLIALGLYTVYGTYFYAVQRRMVFPRHHIPAPPPVPDTMPGVEIEWLNLPFGRAETWFLPPLGEADQAPFPVMIVAHGNGGLIDSWPKRVQAVRERGIGVLLVEYPGYGRSEGAPTQVSIEQTFLAAYDRLAAREEVDMARVVLFGRSVGGGAVCALAAKRPSRALILSSTFTGIRPMTKKYLLPSFLVRDPFDNLDVVRNYDGPVMVIHGRRDEVVPYWHGTALLAATKNGRMLTYEGGHNDGFPSWVEFWRDVDPFLRNADLLRDRETLVHQGE